MAPHSSTLAWKSHGRRTLVCCSPWGLEALVKWLTGTDEVLDQALNDQQSRK